MNTALVEIGFHHHKTTSPTIRAVGTPTNIVATRKALIYNKLTE
jgi:hypothetical protein